MGQSISHWESADLICPFTFKANLRISPAMAVFLSKWADEYQIQALTEKCERILLGQPVDGAALQHAVKYNLPRRRAQCITAMQRNIERYIDDLSVLTSRECEEHLKALWPQMVKAAGLAEGTVLPPVEHLKSMWPFLAQAVRLQVKAVNYAQLRAEAQLWPSQLYSHLPTSGKADEKARTWLSFQLRLHDIHEP
jgi:hypothetical protein